MPLFLLCVQMWAKLHFGIKCYLAARGQILELLDINGDGMFKNCSTRSHKYWLGVNYLKANTTLTDIGPLCEKKQ